MYINNTINDSSLFEIQLPSNGSVGVLEAQNTTLVPLWVRAGKAGKNSFKFVFVYQSQYGPQGSYRTLRHTLNCQIQPTFRMNAFIRPSLVSLDEFVIGIELENISAQAEFNVTQLTCISPSWTMVPIEES